MKIGYARISTVDQNLELQTDALEKAGARKSSPTGRAAPKTGFIKVGINS